MSYAHGRDDCLRFLLFKTAGAVMKSFPAGSRPGPAQ
jgi:hypothetical protein